MTGQLNRRFVLKTRPSDFPGPEHFEVQTHSIAGPAAEQVLVKIEYLALSPWQGQRLKDFKNFTKPFALGELIDCDASGEVVESRSEGMPVGTRVTGRLGWQEYALARPSQLSVLSPEFDDPTWLSALSSPGQTAYVAMDLFARPMAGQTMVVTSAAGGVGGYAVQLGKISGMRVVGVAGGSRKCDYVVARLGADGCVDHRAPDFSQQLAAWCPEGINLVFDTTGGPVSDTTFEHLAQHPVVLMVGRTVSNNSPHPENDPVNLRQLWAKEATIHCFSRYSHLERCRQAQGWLKSLLAAGTLKTNHVVIDGFDQVPRALGEMLAGHHIGKVIVRC